MTTNAVSETIKIRHQLKSKILDSKINNSLIIIERNDSKKNPKNYIYKRLSETLRVNAEYSFYNSFSELIFLELFSPNQTYLNFDLLLQQTIELLIGQVSLFNVNIMINMLLSLYRPFV